MSDLKDKIKTLEELARSQQEPLLKTLNDEQTELTKERERQSILSSQQGKVKEALEMNGVALDVQKPSIER